MGEQLRVADRKEWRSWLEKNHSSRNAVWLLFYKRHTGKPSMPYNDAVEEALCFGWIDSLVKRVDDEQYVRKFTPRKQGSVWSETNKRRVERLVREGRMTDAGLAKVEAAKASGEWSKHRVREKALEIPTFFREALATNKKALENFNALAPSYKRNIVGWVASAKRKETRRRRLAEAIGVLERCEKLGLK
jgi:uncharacterized protein YdeI (YjbR/CyaY-like superfamily)